MPSPLVGSSAVSAPMTGDSTEGTDSIGLTSVNATVPGVVPAGTPVGVIYSVSRCENGTPAASWSPFTLLNMATVV